MFQLIDSPRHFAISFQRFRLMLAIAFSLHFRRHIELSSPFSIISFFFADIDITPRHFASFAFAADIGLLSPAFFADFAAIAIELPHFFRFASIAFSSLSPLPPSFHFRLFSSIDAFTLAFASATPA